FYCINERISRRRGTVISTNLSMGMLKDTYSDRVTSRLMSHYTTIPLYGQDIRVMKGKS
ncbi:MAG: DNA replication protein DnaC, partial [Lachnospiraceae bacterium]|nr:DNA replication protein DnaC [Lachnospiraceae bacterium]